MSSVELAPMFTRLFYATDMVGRSYVSFLKYFRWEECGYLMTAHPQFTEMSYYFHEMAIIENVVVYGTPDYPGLPIWATYAHLEEGEGKETIDAILESQTRIIVSITPVTPFLLFEYLYD